MHEREQGFPKYEVPQNRSPRGGWWPAGDVEAKRDISDMYLGLELTGDFECVILTVWAKPLSPEGLSTGEADHELVGELILSSNEAAILAVSLLALAPSDEDFAGNSPGEGRIGLRFPVGLVMEGRAQ